MTFLKIRDGILRDEGCMVRHCKFFEEDDCWLVNVNTIFDAPCIVRRQCNQLIAKASDDGFWYIHLYTDRHHTSSGPIRHKGHALRRPRQMFARFDYDELKYGVAALLLMAAKSAPTVDGEIKHPQMGDAARVIEYVHDSLIMDVFDPSNLHYERLYPAGPDPQELVKQLYEDLTPQRSPADPAMIDPVVFMNFRSNLQLAEKGTATEPAGNTKKIGLATVHEIEDIARFRYADRLERQQFASKFDQGSHPIGVAALPKIGALTKDGKLRRIFPSSLGLERAQRLTFTGELRLPGVQFIKGPKFPALRHTYDVTGCDRVIYHYLMAMFSDDPEMLDFFLPPVYTPHGKFYAQQFNSGLFCTTVVTQCFAAAILQACGREGYVQGDGIMTAWPIQHRHLRKEPDFTINGFKYAPDRPPAYVNGHAKLTSPRLCLHRDKCLWELRRQIYITILHADPASLPPSHCRRPPFAVYDAPTLSALANAAGACLRLRTYYGQTGLKSSGWDVAPTKNTARNLPPELRKPCDLAHHARRVLD